ncbi:MAG TPA: M24 family metallopeptidase [Rhodanobacter sp.]|nr:M24 family metallopeptidase [Rhodanobacter sp.]
MKPMLASRAAGNCVRTAMFAVGLLIALPAIAQTVPPLVVPMTNTWQADAQLPPILPLRDRAKVVNDLLAERLETVVPKLMRDNHASMWIVMAREYFEEPVIATMLDAESMHARRRTILVFYNPGNNQPIERMTVSRYDLGDLFKSAWDPDKQPDQWKAVADIVTARDPANIAINTSDMFAFADGMTLSQYKEMMAALPEKYRSRVVSGERLAIGWLETRTPAELKIYPGIVRIAHALIAEAFSPKVITPGKTTTDDVVWYLRQRMANLGIDTWFQPSVGVQRKGAKGYLQGDTVIQPGDLLWTDFGITYLRLNTDTQEHAYVLKPGEKDAPAGLKAGLKAVNGVQDALLSSFKANASGNSILLAALATSKDNGLDANIYSHPIGFHGHGAGSSIGMADNQRGNDPRGEYPVHANATWSIELRAFKDVPEWDNQRVEFRQEEDAYFDGKRVTFLDGRQTELTLIPST